MVLGDIPWTARLFRQGDCRQVTGPECSRHSLRWSECWRNHARIRRGDEEMSNIQAVDGHGGYPPHICGRVGDTIRDKEQR